MANPPASPHSAKQKRQRMILIGGAAVALLLLLYMRSRAGANSPNATSTTDVQSAAAQAAQQQAAQDAAMYGSMTPPSYGGGGFGAGGGSIDPNALGTAIATGLANAGVTQPAPAAPQITINTVGQPAGNPSPSPSAPGGANPGTVVAPSQPSATQIRNRPFLAPGAKAPNYALVRPRGAPTSARWAGPHKPGAGWRGIGGGWWIP